MRIPNWRRIATIAGSVAVASLLGALPASAAQRHTILVGETLTSIAATYGVTIAAIVEHNGIANPDLIYAGQQLLIPVDEPAPAEPAPAAPTAPDPSPAEEYVIQPGDTLWRIAVSRGLTVDAILAANPSITDPNRIYAGATLRLPGGAVPLPGTPSTGAPVGGDVRQAIEHHAATYGLDPLLVLALAWQESGWQQHVVSPSGAIGVMQVLPSTGDWVAQMIVGRPLDIRSNMDDNVLAGTAYLRWLIDHFGGSVDLALAGYYQGPGSVARAGVLPETARYVSAVLAIRDYLAQHGVPPRS
ncbi:MAG: LysM peptidoglycan-binding domain-containing protein [Sphaerobacter sp.]|nr:LysM peptidoglycan-binding domain-containing protein [Sphaerobacter sp.]